jgi:hypothetical protein
MACVNDAFAELLVHALGPQARNQPALARFVGAIRPRMPGPRKLVGGPAYGGCWGRILVQEFALAAARHGRDSSGAAAALDARTISVVSLIYPL